ncbi:MAG: hypothetical protein JOY73_04410 [Actinobacteria bacterium]|nr:hypothetical protein [Actinomycetota bacterium]
MRRSRQSCLRARATVARLDRARELRFRSTWSELAWQPPDQELFRVLVLHDGDSQRSR